MNQREPSSDPELIGFEQSPDLLVVTEGDDHRVRACNALMREVLGTDVADRPWRELADELGSSEVVALFDAVLSTGTTRHLDEWPIRVARPDGTTLEISADLTVAPWRDENGEVRGCIGRGMDLAAPTRQRKDVESERRAAETRYTAALDMMTNLQDALLPLDLPVLPRLDLSARYLLATDESAAGGDWFDAVPRTDGSTALVVGDVVGRGVMAAAVMGQMRAVLHDRLLDDCSIVDALAAVDRYARLHPESRAATLCIATVEPETGDIEYCTAGHPAPLVVGAIGGGRFLKPSGAGPLTSDRGYPVARDRLGPDEILLLYTDGLMERPGVPPEKASIDLARVAGDAAALDDIEVYESDVRRTEQVCDVTLEQLTRATGYVDDITLLAAERTPPFPPLRVSFSADRDTVRRAREQLADWLEPLRIDPLDEFAVLHAAGELLTNSVEHAYVDDDVPDPALELEAHVDNRGELVCTVRDHGRWNDRTPHPDRGRGLGMVSGLVDNLDLTRTADGTTAVFWKRLARSAKILTGSPTGKPEPAMERIPFETTLEGSTLTVRGPVDLTTADAFRAALRRFSRGGAMNLTVDLTAVTHLGSAGVQVLHEIHAIDGAALNLRAPAGTVAQHVLQMVHLPYEEGPVNASSGG